MPKKLWLIFGPVLLALVGVAAVIWFSPTRPAHNLKVEQETAVSLSTTVFKNETKKWQVLADPNHRFVPFFGSSEWSRMDSMHPSVLAEAYDRSYRPFLLGQRGATSLTQFYGMQQMLPEMTNKQAVYVISPQWFVKEGTRAEAFSYYFATTQGLSFLQHQTGTASDQYAAKRFRELMPESKVDGLMAKVATGQTLTKADQQQIKARLALLKREDAFFGQLDHSQDFTKKIKPKADKLPQPYNRAKLYAYSSKEAEAATSNNTLGIKNNFYQDRLASRIKKFKGSQKHYNYTRSPEYNDLQVVLNQMAQTQTDVLFVIPPVNGKWASYTGLNEARYQKSVQKIKYQLQSQGFNKIADLSQEGNKPHFMEDTIHMGWNGWLKMDDYVRPFLEAPSVEPNYRINDRFLSSEWAQYVPKSAVTFK